MNVVVIMNDTWRYDCLGAHAEGQLRRLARLVVPGGLRVVVPVG